MIALEQEDAADVDRCGGSNAPQDAMSRVFWRTIMTWMARMPNPRGRERAATSLISFLHLEDAEKIGRSFAGQRSAA